MSLVLGPFAAIHDNDTGAVDLVAGPAGPGGSIAAILLDGAVSVDLDGVVPRQLVAIRVAPGTTREPEVRKLLTTLVGGMELVDACVAQGRNLRNGQSADVATASSDLVALVSALDVLGRGGCNAVTAALCVLEAQVRAALLALPAATAGLPTRWAGQVLADIGWLELIGLPAAARSAVGRMLEDASALGLVDRGSADGISALVAALLRPEPTGFNTDIFSYDRHASVVWSMQDRHGADMVRAEVTVEDGGTEERAVGGPQGRGPASRPDQSVPVHAGTEFGPERVSAALSARNNATVLVDIDWVPAMRVWARARRVGDQALVAVCPLGVENGLLRGNLLVPDTEVEVDVTHALDAPWCETAASNVEKAFSMGRRAGRLERLGEWREAGSCWDRCVELHRLGGDPWRRSLAEARGKSNVRQGPASTVDHLLG